MSAFDWSNSKTFNQNSRNREKLSDSVAIVEYPAKKYGAYRFLTNPRGTALHWLSTLAKPKAGEKSKKPKINSFPKVCLGFDPETMEVHAEKCPYCSDLEHNPRVELRVNVIDRALQESEPKNPARPSKKESKLIEWNGGKWHVKDGKEGGGWTPVRVLTVTPAIGNSITEITSLNKHKNKKTGETKAFGPDHARYGYDVMIKYDKDASSPAKMYLVQKGDVTAITDEEKDYLIWDIPEHNPEELATAKKEAKRMKAYLCNREGELLFPEAAEEGKKEKKNRYKDKFDADEDLEDSDEDEDEDEDEEDRPSKKSKSKSKKSKNWDDEDEDDEDDDDEDDEDEDERPSKKSKSKSKSKKSKSRDEDDDDDDDAPWADDDEDDDDDEEDDRPKSKKSKSSKSGKMKVKSKSRKHAKIRPRFKSKFKA